MSIGIVPRRVMQARLAILVSRFDDFLFSKFVDELLQRSDVARFAFLQVINVQVLPKKETEKDGDKRNEERWDCDRDKH